MTRAKAAPPVARVRLRDITLADADLLDAWNADPASAGEFNDFGLTPKPTDREALARGPMRNERNGQLIVERVADGQPIGVVGFHAVGYGPNPESRAWNIYKVSADLWCSPQTIRVTWTYR